MISWNIVVWFTRYSRKKRYFFFFFFICLLLLTLSKKKPRLYTKRGCVIYMVWIFAETVTMSGYKNERKKKISKRIKWNYSSYNWRVCRENVQRLKDKKKTRVRVLSNDQNRSIRMVLDWKVKKKIFIWWSCAYIILEVFCWWSRLSFDLNIVFM